MDIFAKARIIKPCYENTVLLGACCCWRELMVVLVYRVLFGWVISRSKWRPHENQDTPFPGKNRIIGRWWHCCKLFTLHSLCSYCRHSWVNVCSDSLKRKYLQTSPQCAECPQIVLRCPFWRGLSFGCHSSTAACSCGALISSAFLQNQYHCPFCFLFFPPVWWFGDKGIVYLTWQV